MGNTAEATLAAALDDGIVSVTLRPSTTGYVELAENADSACLARLRKLPRAFYDRDTRQVARALLGKWFVHVTAGVPHVGRIVETEAYLGPTDKAAHTSHGNTARTRAMFGPPGHLYVYFVYGMHHCMNVVTEPEGVGTAVLLRAMEPVANLSTNTNGPARVCKALGITLDHYGADLLSDTLYIAEPPIETRFETVERPRIGVDYAGEWAHKLLRFYVGNSRFVSKK